MSFFQLDFCVVFGKSKEGMNQESLRGIVLNNDDEDSDDEDSNEHKKKEEEKSLYDFTQKELINCLFKGYFYRFIKSRQCIFPSGLRKMMINYLGAIKRIYFDCIGNIEAKLKANGLKYTKNTIHQDQQRDNEYVNTKHFKEAFKAFKGEFKDESYPHRKRFVTMVDTRNMGSEQEQKISDTMYFYEPPSNCRNIPPKDVVPEWGLSASRTSLLPNIDYDPDKAEHTPVIPDANDKDAKLLKANIGTTSHCKGQLITWSFHVIQRDEIRCYCYWNGQIVRFYPSDMKELLPKIFDMNWNNRENQRFLKSNNGKTNIDSILKRMREKRYLHDNKFEAFRSWCQNERGTA